jgi:hypothetical protein
MGEGANTKVISSPGLNRVIGKSGYVKETEIYAED